MSNPELHSSTDTATILYAVNGTTKRMEVSGPRIAVQIYSNGGGSVTVYTKDGVSIVRFILFTEVYLIDRHTNKENE